MFLHGLGSLPDYVYSLDIARPFENDSRRFVATGGADAVVRVWTISSPKFSLLAHSELQGHSLGVNCVRFSPDGVNHLATGSDDGKIVIWRPSRVPNPDDPREPDIIKWTVYRFLNTLDEVVHLSWSPCGQMIVAAAQREMSHLYNIHTGRALQRLDGHSSRVLGVAWDPQGDFIISQGLDRSARLYARGKKGNWHIRALLRDEILEKEIGKPNALRHKLFIADTHCAHDPSAHFFRRPDWSPDGMMVLLPGGLSSVRQGDYALHMYNRNSILAGTSPTASFTTPRGPPIAVRFHPMKFKNTQEESFFVFAVVTTDSLYVFRSDDVDLVAYVPKIHCTAIVDIAWSLDAQILAVCSTDGYMTIVAFNEGELGGVPVTEAPKAEVEVTEVIESKMDTPGLDPILDAPDKPERRRITPNVVGH
jgi:chromatin assembly factor 1 subunit B